MGLPHRQPPTPTPTPSAAAVADVFKALGDENRVRVFALIAGQDAICVGDVVTVLELPQSTVSRHLASLRRAGLVEARREATWVHYSLTTAPGTVDVARALADLVIASGVFALDAARAVALARAGGCCPRHPARDR